MRLAGGGAIDANRQRAGAARQQPAQDLRQRRGGPEGRLAGCRARRFLRPARPERRRQVEPDRHRQFAGQQEQRHGRDLRHQHRPGPRRRDAPDRTGATGTQLQHVREAAGYLRELRGLLRHPARAGAGARRGGTQERAAVGQGRQDEPHALRRHEAQADDRTRDDDPAAPADPGRAHRRRGHRDPPRHVADAEGDQRRRHHHHPDHALSGGSGEPLPQPRDHRPRQDRHRRPDAQPAGQARRRGFHLRHRRRLARAAAGDRRHCAGRQRRPHPGHGHATGDGPQPRVRCLRRRRHPRALDAHQVQPARGTVRAADRAKRRERSRRHQGVCCVVERPARDGRAGRSEAWPVAPRRAAMNEQAADNQLTQTNARKNLVALGTVVRREVMRILRIWGQTLMPPAITMTLYFLIFGGLIGSRVGQMDGIRYMDFIVPGLVMMSIIQNSYGNISSSFFGAKFGRHVEELLVSPMPNWVILTGYVAGAVLRGLMVGAIVLLIAMLFTRVRMPHPFVTISTVLLGATVFSLAGFINAVYAKKFDDVAIVPTFILTPLTYLGGVFYSVKLLPDWAEAATHANPIFYMVNAFRYGLLGVSDVSMWTAYALMLGFVGGLGALALWLLKRGTGMRS